MSSQGNPVWSIADHLMKLPGEPSHENVDAAYASLWRGGDNRIKYFGPAFFTKWLYFSTYEDWVSNELPPLILDARVANALGWWPYGWSASDYATYPERAEHVRQLWCPDRGSHVVEYALFTIGGRTKGVDGDQ